MLSCNGVQNQLVFPSHTRHAREMLCVSFTVGCFESLDDDPALTEAFENRGWGYWRIVGGLRSLRHGPGRGFTSIVSGRTVPRF